MSHWKDSTGMKWTSQYISFFLSFLIFGNNNKVNNNSVIIMINTHKSPRIGFNILGASTLFLDCLTLAILTHWAFTRSERLHLV